MKTNVIVAIFAASILVVAGAAAYIYFEGQDDEDTLYVAYPAVGYSVFHVGFNMGFFDDLSFKVKPVLITNGSGVDAVESLLAGDVQMAAASGTPFINAMGTNPGKMVGLTAFETYPPSGSSANIQLVAHPAFDEKIPARVTDESGKATNGEAVATAIKTLSANNQGANGGKIVIAIQKGASPNTYFNEWIKELNLVKGVDFELMEVAELEALTWGFTAANRSIDIVVHHMPLTDQLVALGGFFIGDSSIVNLWGSSILCTTTAFYDRYHDQMIEFLEALSKASDWMCANEANATEAATLINTISGLDVNLVKTGLMTRDNRIMWKDNNIDGMYPIAVGNGYEDITWNAIRDSCPHRAIMNSWYD